MKSQLFSYLVEWTLLSIAVIIIPYLTLKSKTGLVACFIASFVLDYTLGAFIHILPWYNSPDLYYIVIGFKQVLVATWGFACGCFLIIFIFRNIHSFTKEYKIYLDIKVLQKLFILGLIFYFFNPLANFPTFRILTNFSWNFTIINTCLLAYYGFCNRNKKIIILACFISFLFPIYTVLYHGFLGYGIMAFLIICIFISFYFRPRYLLVFFLIVISYLSLSFYVTYMREREFIRLRLWYKTSDDRSAVKRIAKNFEFFNFRNLRHLDAIDQRMNQSIFIGRSVYNLENKYVHHTNGELILNALSAFIPRFIWPEKPIQAGGGDIVERYTLLQFAKGTSVGSGLVFEFYIEGGQSFVFLGYFVLGILVTIFDFFAWRKLQESNWLKFYFFYLVGLSMIGSLLTISEFFMTVGAALFFYFVFIKNILPYFLKFKKTTGNPNFS